jgi:hypothetical protein
MPVYTTSLPRNQLKKKQIIPTKITKKKKKISRFPQK